MAYITKIEVYPQIFFYDKDYLDERLSGSGIKENKGRFFGAIIEGGTATFTDAAINPLAPIDNYLKFDIFAGENYSPSIDIDLIYQQFLEKFLLLPEIQTAIGINYYILDDVESEHWKEIRITGIDGELFYVVPSPSNINVLLPIRVRFFYRITYKSGEQEILLSFPQQANGFYETVLNADRPYQFLPDTDKEYAPNEWQVFDIDGEEMLFRGEGENPTPYNITANSNGAYVLLKESIIGCYDNELMRQKAMVDSRVFLGQTVLDEVKADSRLPASIQELLIHDWTFAYRDEDQKTTTGQNVYDVKSSFIRRRCYFVPYTTGASSVIMAKFIDARTSEEYPINGLDRIALTFSSVEPMIIMDDTITSLSDVIHSIKAKIDCSGTIEDFTAVERTVNLHLYKLDTGDRWSTQSVTNPPEPVTIGNIEHGGNKIDTIFERLSREDLEEMCGLPANSTHAWLGNVVVSYTGTFNGNPLTIMQSFDFMLGIDKCISISRASLVVSGGIWRSTSLEVLIEMPSITPAFIKNRILGELFIPVNGLFLRYAGTLAGQIVGSASPARYFKAPSASVSYGTNAARISFTGNNAIYNAIGSPITLVNGTVFLFVTVRDGQANGIDVPYNVEIPVTGGDLNYTVSNPPDITEVDPKIETLISQV